MRRLDDQLCVSHAIQACQPLAERDSSRGSRGSFDGEVHLFDVGAPRRRDQRQEHRSGDPTSIYLEHR